MKKFLTLNALVLRSLLLLGLGTGASFANTVVGTPADPANGICQPFGCDPTDVNGQTSPTYDSEYQQVYNSGQFTGPMTITGLQFYNTQFDNSANQASYAINSGTWTISLSTTTADWNTLDHTYGNNIGGDNTMVFSGNLAQSWAFGDTLNIPLSTFFTYNPTPGQNLLMDVVAGGVGTGGGTILFDENGLITQNNFMGLAVDLTGNSPSSPATVFAGVGLVTGFETQSQTVPEPSTLAPLGGLLLVLAGALRRQVAQ